MSESDKQSALVPVQHTALIKAGAKSLVARGHADLRINEEAEEWLKKGCELRDQERYEEAIACFMRGIELNPYHSELQFMLGIMYEYCEGVPQDDAQTVAWYLKAAEQGHSGAQFNLGLLYEFGSGLDYRAWLANPDRIPINVVTQDRTQAVLWYRKAAEQGHSEAQQRLGQLYENGQGATQDHSESVAGHKVLLLDAPGEMVWLPLLSKTKDQGGRYPLGADENWKGISLEPEQVNLAIAYLKGGAENALAGTAADEGAAAGYNRGAKALEDARDAQGGATILRGDYRADTMREGTIHSWLREHGLDRSHALATVADQSEFVEIAHKLREMGYHNVTPKGLAMDLMAKAMSGDTEFDVTDEQREALVSTFLMEAMDEKGPRILANLPRTDPRLNGLINDLFRLNDLINDLINEVRRG